MGDVVSLVEKVQSTLDEKSTEELEDRIMKNQFSLIDLLFFFDASNLTNLS